MTKPLKKDRHQVMLFKRRGYMLCQHCPVGENFSNECPEFRAESICVVIPAYGDRIKSMVMSLPQVLHEHEPLVDEFVFIKIALDITKFYVGRNGVLSHDNGTVTAQSVLVNYSALLSHLERLSKLLKMTPGARDRIGGKSFVDHIQ